VRSAGDKPREVRHIHHEVGTHLVRDRTHAGEVEDARIGRASTYDDLGLDLNRLGLECVVVDGLGVLADLVPGDLVELAREVELVAMRQVPAMRKVEPEERVSGLQQRHVSSGIRLRAGVWLHIGVLGAKDLLGAVAGEVLHHVRDLATTVVALAGVALGVLVGEDRSSGLKHRARDEVLAGDHLQAFVLAQDLLLHEGEDLRVLNCECGVQVNGHTPLILLAPELSTARVSDSG